MYKKIKESARDLFFKIWYWYVSTIDKNAEIIFMNYGYSKGNNKIDLKEEDVIDRYSIQLYDFAASGRGFRTTSNVEGLDVLEIGCGRGGGLSYVNKYLKPKTTHGVDLNKKAIEFCTKQYTQSNATFQQGDAQNLNIADNSFDIIINVESSHRYPNMDKFLQEVYRILRPGGSFLFTDFRFDSEMEELNNQLDSSKLKVLDYVDITSNVVESLKFDTERRHNLVKKLVPKFLHNIAYDFSGSFGSDTYLFFLTKQYEYFYYVIKKEE